MVVTAVGLPSRISYKQVFYWGGLPTIEQANGEKIHESYYAQDTIIDQIEFKRRDIVHIKNIFSYILKNNLCLGYLHQGSLVKINL